MKRAPKEAPTPLTAAQHAALVELVAVFRPISDERCKSMTGWKLRKIDRAIAAILKGERSAPVTILARAASMMGKWAAGQDMKDYGAGVPLSNVETAELHAALTAAGVMADYLESYAAASRECVARAERPVRIPTPYIPTIDLSVDRVQLAPFLSVEGHAVLVVLGPGVGGSIALHGLLEVTEATGALWHSTSDGAVYRRPTVGTYKAGPLMATKGLLEEGIYRAPWAPYEHAQGGALIVLDRDSRMIASFDFADEKADVAGAYRDAQAVLEMAQDRYQTGEPLPPAPTSGWRDSYEEDDRRRGYGLGDSGDDWKK